MTTNLNLSGCVLKRPYFGASDYLVEFLLI